MSNGFQFQPLTEDEHQIINENSRQIIEKIEFYYGGDIDDVLKPKDDKLGFMEEVSRELAEIEFIERKYKEHIVMSAISKRLSASQYEVIEDFYKSLDNVKEKLSLLLANRECVEKINGLILSSKTPESINEIGIHKDGKRLKQLMSALEGLNNKKVRELVLSHKKGRGNPASSWYEIKKCERVIKGIKKYLPSVEISPNSVTYCNTLVSIFVKGSPEIDSRRLIEQALRINESPDASPWRMLR